MNVVSWGAEIYGGCPPSVGYETTVKNKDGVEVPSWAWMQEFEPYKLHAHHPYYGNSAEPANDELAELRAFKEAAIKRFPELAPVDPDLLEAHEVAEKFAWPRTDPQSSMWEGSASQMALAAIKRGRELERYAQGLTTPKD